MHANLLIACTQVAGETGLTGIVIFLTEIEPQHGTLRIKPGSFAVLVVSTSKYTFKVLYFFPIFY